MGCPRTSTLNCMHPRAGGLGNPLPPALSVWLASGVHTPRESLWDPESCLRAPSCWAERSCHPKGTSHKGRGGPHLNRTDAAPSKHAPSCRDNLGHAPPTCGLSSGLCWTRASSLLPQRELTAPAKGKQGEEDQGVGAPHGGRAGRGAARRARVGPRDNGGS